MKKLVFDIAKIITAVATIGGSALWFDSKFDNQTESLDDIKQEVMYNNVQIGQLSDDVLRIQDTLEDFESEHFAQGEKINSIVWGLKNITRFTPEDFEEILDEMMREKEFITPRHSIYPDTMRGDVVFQPLD